MTRHPEQRDGELYMGSADPRVFSDSVWITKRLGTVALRVDGRPPEGHGAHVLRPCFIQASEVEQAIRIEEANPRPWSAERIAILRQLLAERDA